MKAVLIFAILLASCANASGASSIYCRIWPHSEACRPATIVVPPAPAPIIVAPPVVAPAPVVERVRPVPVKRVQPVRRIKSTWVKPKRAKGAVRWWCTFVPVGTTAAQIMREAKARNRTVSAADAEVCAASKKS